MDVYFISGLGADRRIFKNIQLPVDYKAIYLDWINPLKKETLRQYAMRLCENINTDRPFVLVGLSMGGMLSTEIAHLHRPTVTVLISSIPSPADLPVYFRLAGALRLQKLVPVTMVKYMARLKRKVVRESDADRELVLDMINNSDSRFIHWAMGAILGWRAQPLLHPYIHIHGTNDGVLPVRFTRPTHFIRKGGHLMVLNRAAEINAILADALTAVRKTPAV